MTSPLKVITLISGGKDSLFSILHCLANGHAVVALANLYPPASATDEDVNSYMYQTVGHSVIPLYEQALEIPLHRQEITGKSINTSRDYAVPTAEREHDETEDMVTLLERVMEAHPEANAVSTGAILSTYQRTRVESVALRLGLEPLSYLWQYPMLPPYTQSALLHDMAAVGQESIIIKTASGGLDERFLGLNVADRVTVGRLAKAMARFGDETNGAIVGEGGEFETLAIHGPKPLWKKRLKVESGLPRVLEGGQTSMKIQSVMIMDRGGEVKETLEALRIPNLFDDEFMTVLEVLESHSDNSPLMNGNAFPKNVPIHNDLKKNESSSSLRRLHVNALHDRATVLTSSNMVSGIQPTGSSSQQLSDILSCLGHMLDQGSIQKTDINHCTLLLRDMADFGALNAIYNSTFNVTNPPARVTVAVGDAMPEGSDVMLSIIADRTATDDLNQPLQNRRRDGLHVQGISYWAPANIGPYSQAISVPLPPVLGMADNMEREGGDVVYLAGQIPLIPASMQVYQDQGFPGQAALSLQHVWRIGRAKRVKWWTAAVALIPASEKPEEQVHTAQAAWAAIHQPKRVAAPDTEDEAEDEAMDPWDRLNRTPAYTFNHCTDRSPIPDYTAVSSPSSLSRPLIPPCFVAQVHSLPSNVRIEWSAVGLTSSSIQFDLHPAHKNLTVTAPQQTRSRFLTVEIHEQADVEVLKRLGEDGFGEWASATLYVGRGLEWSGEMRLKGVQWMPCLRVWGEGEREARAVLVGRVDAT